MSSPPANFNTRLRQECFSMARRHWLDPLARQLLVVSGQLPASRAKPKAGPPAPGTRQAQDAPDTSVERELVALKLRHNPDYQLTGSADVEHAAALGWRLDVNRARESDWRRLPGLTDPQLDLLLRLQAGGVQLSGPEDLQRLLNLSDAQLQLWSPLLAFRWYAEPMASGGPLPPLDLNRATARQLETLGLSAERLQRLLRERARRPFQDLADLQQRLQIPPALVEAWIGKVCFGAGPVGPELPPGTKRR
jgi:DNA uptake protein ComE-like DNA-binding protein